MHTHIYTYTRTHTSHKHTCPFVELITDPPIYCTKLQPHTKVCPLSSPVRTLVKAISQVEATKTESSEGASPMGEQPMIRRSNAMPSKCVHMCVYTHL